LLSWPHETQQPAEEKTEDKSEPEAPADIKAGSQAGTHGSAASGLGSINHPTANLENKKT
jgi:hypothetical protein